MRPSGARHARRPRSRIVLLGWYGSDNLGDEAVLQAVAGALQRRGFRDLFVLSTDPARTTARTGLPSGPRTLLSVATLKAMWRARALVLGGGGLIQDGTSLYNLPVYTFFVAVARLFGLTVVGWGLGVEPVYTPLGNLQARFICGAAAHLSVRDDVSRKLLMLAGVPRHAVKVTADPAFLIEPDEVHVESPKPADESNSALIVFCIRDLSDNHPGINLHYLLPVSARKRLGLGWRPPPARRRRFVQGMARGIKVCAQEFGARVELLPLWPGRDDDILTEVEREAQRRGVPAGAMERVTFRQTPSGVAAYLGQADLLVSMRLHALIFAASQGVPMLAISYARKVRGLMRKLHSERWVVEVERRTPPPEEIEMKLRQLWAQREQEATKLHTLARQIRGQAEADADSVAHLLMRDKRS